MLHEVNVSLRHFLNEETQFMPSWCRSDSKEVNDLAHKVSAALDTIY